MSSTLKKSDVLEFFGGSSNISYTNITGVGQYVLNPSISVNSINIAGTQINDTHAATVGYVKQFVQGLDAKESVRCATTGNIILSGLQDKVDEIDLASGDRVLVKDQTNKAQNGIYLAKAGAWERAADFDAPAEVQGAFVFVEGGSQNIGKGFVQVSNAPQSIGSGDLTFTQFNGTSKAIIDSIDNSFNDVNTTLSGKQNTIGEGGLTISKTAGLQSALDAKAPLVSPTFTGTITLSGSTSTITLSGDYIYLNLPTVAGPVGTIYYDASGVLKVVLPPA